MLSIIILLWAVVAVLLFCSRKNIITLPHSKLRIPATINSGILALAAANFLWRHEIVKGEIFPDFIGGFLAMSALPKSFEYHAFYLGIAVFVILFPLMMKFYSCFQQEQDIAVIHEISLYTFIIPALAVGQSFLYGFFTIAFQASAVSVCCGMAAAACKLRFRNMTGEEIKTLLAGMFFGLASHVCIRVFCNRIPLPDFLLWIYWGIWTAALIAAFRRETWNKFLVLSQLGLPLAFGNLLVPLQFLRNKEIFPMPFNNTIIAFVTILILLGYAVLYAAFRSKSRNFFKLIPSLPLAALLCMFCAQPDQWGFLSYDDYHNGELVLPWFLYQKFGCHMYIDYIPSRGIVNYIPGFFLWLFKGHDFSYIHSFIKWADLPLYFLAVTILRRRAGLLAAVAGCAGITLLTPNIGAGMMLGLLGWAWFSSPAWSKKPSLMLLFFFITGLLGSLYSLTDTLVVYVAMMPMAFCMLYLAWQKERKILLTVLSISVLSAGVLLLIPLCRNILWGMLQTVFLQSDTYTAAHCVPLLKKNTEHFTIYYIAVNYGFLILTALFALRLLFPVKKFPKDCIHFFASASLVILGILLIQRAAGRAGCSADSRGIAVTILLLTAALPVWYRDWLRKRLSPVCILVLCLLWGTCGNYLNCFASLDKKITGVLFEPENTVDPEAAGLPHLGKNTVLQPEHFKHHQQVKAVITSILPEVETQGGFWDLTNNSTIYAYCGNGIRPPMSYPSAFYVASLPLAEKMRKQVEKSNPSLVLIKGKNIRFYEGNLALRSYPLYAYLMRNYRVFSDIYGKIWMIRRGCENLLAKSNLVKQDSLDDQKLLSDALDYRTIDGYPISWGKSMKTLRKKLTSPEILKVYKTNDNLFILQAPAAGGDFLYLKFNRKIHSKGMAVSWAKDINSTEIFSMIFSSKSDEFLIPLYASTNWYMKNIRSNLLVEHKDTEKEPLQLLEAVMYKRIEK